MPIPTSSVRSDKGILLGKEAKITHIWNRTRAHWREQRQEKAVERVLYYSDRDVIRMAMGQ